MRWHNGAAMPRTKTESKAADRIAEVHKAQTLNYLKATNFKLALLLNFGKHKLEHDRLIF